MNDAIAELIHASKGTFHVTAGVIIGFFNDPQQARRCAKTIVVTSGKKPQVCGNQLSISV